MELPTRNREVLRAQRAFASAPDTRAIKREVEAGNRYVIAKLARMGLVCKGGVIYSKGDADERR
jgi:hypothetical protein